MNENDEFQFLLLQSISRSKIRLNQKRGFLIDYVIGIDQSIRSKEFYDSVKESLNQVDLDHILEAQVQEQDLDLITKLSQERVPGDPENIQSEHHHHQSRGNEYWKAVNHLVTGSKQTTRDGVVSLVKTQMNEMFQKKSLEEMKGLKLQIEEKLRKGNGRVI